MSCIIGYWSNGQLMALLVSAIGRQVAFLNWIFGYRTSKKKKKTEDWRQDLKKKKKKKKVTGRWGVFFSTLIVACCYCWFCLFVRDGKGGGELTCTAALAWDGIIQAGVLRANDGDGSRLQSFFLFSRHTHTHIHTYVRFFKKEIHDFVLVWLFNAI